MAAAGKRKRLAFLGSCDASKYFMPIKVEIKSAIIIDKKKSFINIL